MAAGKNETLFHELDLFLSYRVLEAFVRDSLFRRHDDPEAVLARCFREDELRFPDARSREAFTGVYRELWTEVRESYNLFTDQIRGPLRGRALQLVERHLNFLRRLEDNDVRPAQLPDGTIQESARAMAHVEEFLQLRISRSRSRRPRRRNSKKSSTDSRSTWTERIGKPSFPSRGHVRWISGKRNGKTARAEAGGPRPGDGPLPDRERPVRRAGQFPISGLRITLKSVSFAS